MPTSDLIAKLDWLRAQINQRLQAIVLPEQPSSLYQPLRYSLKAPGKRLRPILTILVGETLGAALDDLWNPALSIEVLHTFTLVHDDIMDHATQRRGRPTIHVKWDTNTALLAGDALLALAYEILLSSPSQLLARLGRELAQTMRDICAGQALDVDFEKQAQVTTTQYLDMIARKTGQLLGLACHFGALLAGVPKTTADTLRDFGIKLGQAFQVQDDLLEITAETEQMGKSLISDISSGKKTYPVILVLQSMSVEEGRNWLTALQAVATDRSHIRHAFEKHNAIEGTRLMAEQLFAQARQQLSSLPVAQRQTLEDFIGLIAKRQS